MENPLNNFQQKPKLGENEVEKREKRIKTIEIEVDGQIHSLETETYDFEYPEGIQKETGILGYERTVIASESLIGAVESQIQQSLGLSISELGINKYSDLLLFLSREVESFSQEEVSKLMNFNLRKNKQSKAPTLEENLSDLRIEIWSKFNRNLIREKLLLFLSDNEYPNKSFNHRYGWYGNPETISRHKGYFKQDFFLGKIYDLEKIKEESKNKPYPFSSAELTTGDNSRYHANISIYDQENPNERLTNEKKMPLGEVLNYEDKIKEGTVYATTTFAGLNLSSGGFFGGGTGPGIPSFEDEICLGFSFKLDNFMQEYYEKTFCIYAKQVEDNPEDIGSLIDTALFLLFNRNGENIEPETWENMTEEDEGYLNSILEKNINRRLSDKELKKINDRYRSVRGNLSSDRGFGVYESKLPIFIGHKELPQLSWGHATYANYMNEKGLNFFKFKHADHLPKKSDLQR